MFSHVAPVLKAASSFLQSFLFALLEFCGFNGALSPLFWVFIRQFDFHLNQAVILMNLNVQMHLRFLERFVSTLEEKKHHEAKLIEGLKDLASRRMELQNSLSSFWPKQVSFLFTYQRVYMLLVCNIIKSCRRIYCNE